MLQAAEAAKRELERRVSDLERDLTSKQKLQNDLEGEMGEVEEEEPEYKYRPLCHTYSLT